MRLTFVVGQTVTALSSANFKEMALRLFLQCALGSSETGFEDIAYEFATQAFTIYEEDISDSKTQVFCLEMMMSTMERLSVFGPENYETLATKVCVGRCV
jgi:vacuolar protein sorting-associated protein 35